MKKYSLGPLEQQVMNCVWKKDSCTTREIVECLNNKEKPIAYNTIQTIMSRLTEKGLLRRTLVGKTHVYKATFKKKNILQTIISQKMSGFVNEFGEEALIAFVDGIEDITDETRAKLIKKLKDHD